MEGEPTMLESCLRFLGLRILRRHWSVLPGTKLVSNRSYSHRVSPRPQDWTARGAHPVQELERRVELCHSMPYRTIWAARISTLFPVTHMLLQYLFCSIWKVHPLHPTDLVSKVYAIIEIQWKFTQWMECQESRLCPKPQQPWPQSVDHQGQQP